MDDPHHVRVAIFCNADRVGRDGVEAFHEAARYGQCHADRQKSEFSALRVVSWFDGSACGATSVRVVAPHATQSTTHTKRNPRRTCSTQLTIAVGHHRPVERTSFASPSRAGGAQLLAPATDPLRMQRRPSP